MTAFAENDDVIVYTEESVDGETCLVETGRVHGHTFVKNEDLLLQDTLERGIIDVERVRSIMSSTQHMVSRDGHSLSVVPALNERFGLTKQLFFVEQVRSHRSTSAVPVELPASRRTLHAIEKCDAIVASTPEKARI